MLNYKTPGVYVEEESKLPPSVAGVATAIPAFVGYTAAGTANVPVRISSLLDYEAAFGGAPVYGVDEKGVISGKDMVLYDSLRLFYDNGGNICYVVSAGKYTEKPKAEKDCVAAYKKAIDSLQKEDEVTLLVLPDAVMVLGASSLGTVQDYALAHCGKMKDRFAILDVKEETSDATKDSAAFRDALGSSNLMYGAAYYPFLKSVYSHTFGFTDVTNRLLVNTSDEKARQALNDARKDVSESSDEDAALKIKAYANKLPGYAAALAALDEEVSLISPSGAMAGIIAANDSFKGVWHAPANVSVASVSAVNSAISDTEQENLNIWPDDGKSINAIRKFTGKGILVWGARTLDGNSGEWKYIPVRRLFTYIEESIQKSTAWAVFQPNNTNTWVKLEAQITNFLSNLWRDGAMAGATTEEAFFVNVGKGVTMTQDDINNGYLIIEVGIAAVRPAEFIVLKFSHKVEE